MIIVLLLIILGLGILVLTWDKMVDFYLIVAAGFRKWLEGFKSDAEVRKPAVRGSVKYGSDTQAGTAGHSKLGRCLLPGSQCFLPDLVAEHILFLLRITLGLGTDRSLRAFVILSVVPAVFVFARLIGKISVFLAIVAFVTILLLPYCFLRLKLEKIRVASSREGEILITELLNYYKINYFNMQQAIDVAAASLNDAPVSKKLLVNLSGGLNKVGSEAGIRRLVQEFKISINTSWGDILASNMYFALTSGTEITQALSDLADKVKKARKVAEYARRENNEASLMIRYLMPVSYLLTVLSAIGFFGLSSEKFLYYQFETEVEMTWFVIFIIIYLGGLIINAFLDGARLDL